MKPLRVALCCIIVTFVCSCSMTMSSKRFAPVEHSGNGDAVLYVYRTFSVISSAVGINVFLDVDTTGDLRYSTTFTSRLDHSKIIGVSLIGAYFVKSISPGPHVIYTINRVTDDGFVGSLKFTAEPDRDVYVRVNGWDVEQVDEQTALKEIKGCCYDEGWLKL